MVADLSVPAAPQPGAGVLICGSAFNQLRSITAG
jgi:hypothetical protein